EVGLPDDAMQTCSSTDRAFVDAMLTRDEEIDIIIPRGGEGLIRAVSEKSRIPVIKHYKGVCHVFIDKDADPHKATAIAVNAKVQNAGVCNTMETLLIHADVADKLLSDIAKALIDEGVEIHGCEKTCALVPEAKPASEDDWGEEYLNLTLAVRVVSDVDAAIEHIQKYGSDHTESIVTENKEAADKFIGTITSSSVMVNASTRFADGFEYGLGAEIGISTTKLHAYGPMGLTELTTTKFVVMGDGQIRE
ncbi:MAG: glutamate-5-semialdehyde dehydrogenase, partial [Chloroflexi bacterium]|nr:glutamate-5-semialdehyde dehydrogenase [Chloroflexota bacterium]